MADHQSQDVDSRLVQSVVDRTTDVDGNKPDSIQNLGGSKGDATDSTDASAPNASTPSESKNKQTSVVTPATSGVTESSKSTETGDVNTKQTETGDEQSKDAESGGEASQSAGGPNDTSLKKDGDKQQVARSASLKKPALKSMSLNKAFLSSTGSSNVPGSKLLSSQQAGSPSINAPKPRLISKIGSMSTGRAGGIGLGRSAGQPVWNKNMPPPQQDSKKMSDEELQAQLGIHLTARLGADDPSNKEANWADIDDEEWNPPEEIEWNDGTKIALPQHEELPATTEPATTDDKVTSSSKPSTLVLINSSSSAVDRKDTDRPQESMQPPPRAGPWAPIPPGPFPYPQPTVNNQPYHLHQQHHYPGRPGGPGGPPGGMPPSMQQHHQSQPYRPRQFDQRGPPPPFVRQNDPRQQQPPPPPQAKEVLPDDFNRNWRDRQPAPSRELFNSETGKLEPVDEMNRNRNMLARNGRLDMGPPKPPMSVLQRQQPLSPSSQGPLSSGEASPGFQQQQQQHPSSRFDMDPRRRRASSNVSMGSNSGRRMSFPRNEVPHSEVFPRDDELQPNQPPTQGSNSGQVLPKSPILQTKAPETVPTQPSAAVYQPPTAGGRGVYHPPSANIQHASNTAPADGAAEDPLAMQERVMKESREQARKRREEREKAEEEARRARIEKKLAELTKIAEPKPEEQVKEVPQEALQEAPSESPKQASSDEPKDTEVAPPTATPATTSTENHMRESNWRATAQSSSEADEDQKQIHQQHTKPSETYRPNQSVYRPPGERRSASPMKDPKEQPWRLNMQSNQGTPSQPTWSGKPQHQQSNPWGPVAGEKPRFPPIDGLGQKPYETPPPTQSQLTTAPPQAPSREAQEAQAGELPSTGGSRQQVTDNRLQDKWRRGAPRDAVDQDQAPNEVSRPVNSTSQTQESTQAKPTDQLTGNRQQQQGQPPITSAMQPSRDSRHEMSRPLNMATANDHNQRRGFNQGGRPGPQHQQGVPRDPRGRPLNNWNAGGEDPHARWRNPEQLQVQQPRKLAEQPKPRSPSISQDVEAKSTVEEPESISIDSTWRKVEIDQFGNRKFVKEPPLGATQTNAASPETKPASLAPQPSVSLPPPPPSQPMSAPYSSQGRHPAPLHTSAQMQHQPHPHHSQQPQSQQMMANMGRGPGQSPPDSGSMAHVSPQSGGMHHQHQHPGLQQHSQNIGPQAGSPARPRYFPAGGAALIQQHLGTQQSPENAVHNAIESPLQSPSHGSMQLQHGVSASSRSPTLQHAHLHGHNQRGPSPSRAARGSHAHRPSDGPTSPRLQSSTTAFEMVQSKILGLVNKTPKAASHSTSSATEISEPEYIVTSGDTADLFVDESTLVTTSKPAFDEPTVPVRVTVSLPGSRKQEPLEPEPLVEEDSQTRPTEEELFGELFPRDFGSLPHVRFPTAIPQALKRPAPQLNTDRVRRKFGNLHVQPQAIPTELTIARDYNAMKRPIMTVKLGPDSERKEVVMQAGQHLHPHSQLQQQQQLQPPPPQQQQQHGRNGNGNRRQSSSGRGGSGGEWRGGRGGNSYKGGNRDGRSSPGGGYNHNGHHSNNSNNNNNNGNNGGQGNNGFNYRNQGSIRGMPRKLASPVQ